MERDENNIEFKPDISRRMVENFISELEKLLYDLMRHLFKRHKTIINNLPGVHNTVKAGLLKLYDNEPLFRDACNKKIWDAQEGISYAFHHQYCDPKNFEKMMRYILATHLAIENLQGGEDKKEESEESMLTQRTENDRVGLQNLGNTCWANSILQALFMNYKFCTAVLGSDARSQPLLLELQTLFALLLLSPRSVISPLQFILSARPDGFEPGDQADSSEFLTHLFQQLQTEEKQARYERDETESMDTDCNLEVEKVKLMQHAADAVNTEAKDTIDETESMDTGEGQRIGQACDGASQSSSMQSLVPGVGENSPHANTDSPKQFTSLVKDTFGGRRETVIKCEGCKTESVKGEEFLDIPLAFPPERNSHKPTYIQEMINLYASTERLTGDNQYQCDECKGLKDAKRFIRISQLASHLILIIKCFEYDNITEKRKKIIRDMEFKEDILFSSEPYYLYAAVIHSGSTPYNGHYYTMAQDKTHVWMFNDSTVGPYDESSWGKNDMPYILFYSRYEEECHPSVKTELMVQLQPHLALLIMNDSEEFRQEMEQQEKKKRKRQQEVPPDNGVSTSGGNEIKTINSPGGSGETS